MTVLQNQSRSFFFFFFAGGGGGKTHRKSVCFENMTTFAEIEQIEAVAK